MSRERVCIIGAGPSGCAALRAFKSAEKKGKQIPELVCYERQSTWGGLWNYSWRTGVDNTGEPVHNSMYRHLWSNGPKECLEFADYSFEEHFGFQIPSYPPREVLHEYITGRVMKAGVTEMVRCNSLVKSTTYDDATKKFTVVVRDTTTNAEFSEQFDWVIVGSGHFSTPNVPEFAGMHNFHGRIMHAHDFRSAEVFKDQNILIVGTSYSAEDIASQCYKYGVKSVTCSWRTNPMTFHWPDNFKTVPLLEKMEGKTCFFKGGETAEIDTIILCTGYIHHFPFIEPKLRLTTANRLWPDMLHDGVVLPSNTRMLYLGMQDQWFTFNMFDAQAWYARDIILGTLKLPDAKSMAEEWKHWRGVEEAISGTDESMIRFQGDYVQRLIEKTDYPTFNVEGVIQCFLEWEHNKHENIMTFRDKAHTSLMTGTKAPVHHTPWLVAFDDSVPCYVDQNRPKPPAVN